MSLTVTTTDLTQHGETPNWTEGRLQEECLLWLNKHYRAAERWFHHIPNGELRTGRDGARLQAMGVKSGVSDTFLPEPCGCYHGLYVELKKDRFATVSTNQKLFIAHARAKGYCVVVLDNLPAFVALIPAYLALGPGQALGAEHFTRFPL